MPAFGPQCCSRQVRLLPLDRGHGQSRVGEGVGRSRLEAFGADVVCRYYPEMQRWSATTRMSAVRVRLRFFMISSMVTAADFWCRSHSGTER